MQPYYSDDHVTLYHARWEDVPPSLLAADVLVTDPPYGIGWDGTTGNRTSRFGNVKVEGDDKPFDPAPLLALGLPSVLFGANHYADRLPPSPTWLVWDKRDGAAFGPDQADCEMAWSNLGGPARLHRLMWNTLSRLKDDRTAGGTHRPVRGSFARHPTQKPVALMRWVIEKCPDGSVLDPYAGSGTTLIAAKSLNRRAVGVEMVEAYCEDAAKRLSQEVLGLVA